MDTSLCRTCLARQNRINDLVVNAVMEAVSEMREIARKVGIVKIDFTLHPDIDRPSATFNTDIRGDEKLGHYEQVSEILFNADSGYITVISENNRSGYLDDTYGDYFDVGQSIGHIYQAFMQVVGNDDLKPIELE